MTGHDGDFVPFSRCPDVYWTAVDEVVIYDGLESPSETGVESVEDGGGGFGDDIFGLRAKTCGDFCCRY